jgi:tryptophan-rich sensory protein
MGVAAWIIWRAAPAAQIVGALLIFILQLGLNFLWSVMFFAWRRPDAAFIDLLLMWLAIVGTIIAFAAIRPWAAVLLVPYLAWVTFAGYLNGGIWRLNRPARTTM